MDKNSAAPGEDVLPEEDLSDVKYDDSVVFILFWSLAFVVFLQFFTRYVLNNSLGWTEEIARFLLIGVTFFGAVMAVRKESHIAVELAYRYLPRRMRQALQMMVDAVSLIFYAVTAWLCTEMAGKTQQKMVSIDLPKSVVYWIVAFCFLGMALYQARVMWRHMRTGTSRLIDPENYAVSTANL
ncbi:TRAP transporter small permease [Nitratireductor sp. CH_MIT9313-5]|uniref:TRAP transporter small permease n=1 Tax=Nitratireductor sp. CH_MIT9313-5 TaxID=3107764 RepID=UPI003009ED25